MILNTGAIDCLELVSAISDKAGVQSVVVSIDVIRTISGKYKLFDHRMARSLDIDIISFLKSVTTRGAGEIIIQSVNNDGTMLGYDEKLIHLVSSSVSVPVIALGGAGEIPDFVKAVQAGASAVAAGSMFVFHGRHRAVLITYPSKDELKQQFYQKIM